jgi:hypothetical protein
MITPGDLPLVFIQLPTARIRHPEMSSFPGRDRQHSGDRVCRIPARGVSTPNAFDAPCRPEPGSVSARSGQGPRQLPAAYSLRVKAIAPVSKLISCPEELALGCLCFEQLTIDLLICSSPTSCCSSAPLARGILSRARWLSSVICQILSKRPCVAADLWTQAHTGPSWGSRAIDPN